MLMKSLNRALWTLLVVSVLTGYTTSLVRLAATLNV